MDPDTPGAAELIAHLSQRRGPPAPPPLDIGPDEVNVVSLFFALATQWRTHAATGARTGLDYAAIRETARMIAVKVTPALFNDLRIMEAATLEALAAATA